MTSNDPDLQLEQTTAPVVASHLLLSGHARRMARIQYIRWWREATEGEKNFLTDLFLVFHYFTKFALLRFKLSTRSFYQQYLLAYYLLSG